LKLFSSTFYISAFTFGGGYVIIPLMKKKFAQDLKWITEDEMLDLVAIAQSSPGPVAVNASLLVGYKVAGFAGAVITVFGTILPPLIILSVISAFYDAFIANRVIAFAIKGMQAGVAAVIADIVTDMGKKIVKDKNALSIAVMIAAFVITYFFKLNVIYIILACIGLGIIKALIASRRAKRNGL
jgi:chromate transporter